MRLEEPPAGSHVRQGVDEIKRQSRAPKVRHNISSPQDVPVLRTSDGFSEFSTRSRVLLPAGGLRPTKEGSRFYFIMREQNNPKSTP